MLNEYYTKKRSLEPELKKVKREAQLFDGSIVEYDVCGSNFYDYPLAKYT